MAKVVLSVTNDLSTDQRLHKVCSTLIEAGYEVVLIGRRLKNSPILNRSYKTQRMHLWFNSGVLFYATYNLRLFFKLLFTKCDLLVANDLDTLLPNFMAAKIKGIPLIYDTHEYFCGMPELMERPFVRSVWKGIESSIFPKLSRIMTVNDSVANLYRTDYHKELVVLKNYPLRSEQKATKSKEELGLIQGQKVILYQGAVNVERGLEEAIKAMEWVDSAVLLIIGSGNALNSIQRLVMQSKTNKVILKGSLPYDELLNYTKNADLGLAIEKGDSPNYKYSLTNKVFDYIHAGVPILSSRLVENERLFSEWEVGTFIENHQPKHIAERINFMLSSEAPRDLWMDNSQKARDVMTWESQKNTLLGLYQDAMQK